MTPTGLVDAAYDVLDRPGAPQSSLYPMAAALLARQALEARVQSEWRGDEVSLALTSMTNQCHALRQLRDPAIAGRVFDTWSSLSRACHHHPYDLSPSPDEMKTLISDVRLLLECDWHG
jgi:hypothetical protein